MLQALIGSFAGGGGGGPFAGTISTNQTDLNLRTWALANGWNGTAQATITVGSGVIISGSVQGNSTAALTVDGSWPGGVTLVNSGVIAGRGGNGGTGGANPTAALPGNIGGTALTASVAVSINNTGTIAGGGGGGGGGGFSSSSGSLGDDSSIRRAGCGGGGGASSNISSSGGAGGTASFFVVGNPGTNGTYNTAGAGGTKASHPSGGAGGSWGASGTAGVTGNITAVTTDNGGAGGAGGRAVNGNASITWIAFGTRLGSIV